MCHEQSISKKGDVEPTYELLATKSAKTIHSQICLELARESLILRFILAFKGVSIPEGDLRRSGW